MNAKHDSDRNDSLCQVSIASKGDASETNPTPPVADRRPVEITQHGKTRVDPYAWLRDENWQQVLRDPSTLNADIREHLEAEVTHYEQATAHLADLRQTLFEEMRARIKEDESSVPMPDGPYQYYTRFRKAGNYPIFARCARGKENAKEEVIFDGDAEKGDSAYFDIKRVNPSRDHALIAYSTDRLGSEYYDIRIRRLSDGSEWQETISSTSGTIVWSKDSKGFFYVERDDHQRPKRVKFHALGAKPEDDVLIYEESDDSMDLWIYAAAPETFLVIGMDTGETSEAWVVPLDAPETSPQLIAPRLEGQLYDIDHAGGYFYILTNADGAVDFKIMRAPVADPGRAHWEEWVPHRQGVYITGFVLFENYVVRVERENARPRIVIGDYDGNTHEIAMDAAAYALYLDGWDEFKTDTVRYAYESPSNPEQIFDYRMDTKERLLRKTQTVPSGHDESLYAVDVFMAKGDDGAEIPVTVLRLKQTPLDGSAPLFLHGYGSYGSYDHDGFSIGVLSLVDRGVIFAQAHIRGGSAKGHQWYLDGKFGKKKNSFLDFDAAARALVEHGYTTHGKIVAYGASAGGLLVGAAVNLAPELYAGILAEVPFVDVLTTISDPDLPLTPLEWDEWGNPIQDEEAFGWIAGYSPYDNIREEVLYPPILATGGLTDYRVSYWEPAKWIARFRAEARGGPFLLRMNMKAGHAGSVARFERIEEWAHIAAFALYLLGRAEAIPVCHHSG